MFDSVCRIGKNYYTQVFLEEFKYAVKEKKIPECIIDDIQISSDDSNVENSDEEKFNEVKCLNVNATKISLKIKNKE